MKKLLDCFDYLKRYHSDMLDVVSIMLELFIFKKECSTTLNDFIEQSNKRKSMKADFYAFLENLIGIEHYVPISQSANSIKILKVLQTSNIALHNIEQFLHIISQKRTTNKLYYYSTPKEVNDLLTLLLDPKDNDEVYNPCYGIGSIFLSLANMNTHIHLYGEELDERLANIAHLIARFAHIDTYQLYVNDILKQPIFKTESGLRQFDKVICNPPLYAHMGVEQLKVDERFSKIGILAKNYPELVFLTHALAHLKKRGVFIVRNQTLQKSSLEEKLRDKLVQEGMIEAVIELPKNIFPHRSYDFSVLVLSFHNKEILHINANNPHFYKKDGKYNQLQNIDEIAAIFQNKKEGAYSKITNMCDVKTHDLRASYYLSNFQTTTHDMPLHNMDITIFRGQRVHGSKGDKEIDYYDVGIADFAPCGFSTHFVNKKMSGDIHKIHKYRLQPYDILLSLRSILPKVTILGENANDCIAVANAGILILRVPDKLQALGLYCYFFSHEGFSHLKEIYEKSGDNMVSTNELLQASIPSRYIEEAEKRMEAIESLKHEFEALEQKLKQLKES